MTENLNRLNEIVNYWSELWPKKWICFWNLTEIVGKCWFYTTDLNVISNLNKSGFYKRVFRKWFPNVLSMIGCSLFVFTRLSYWVISCRLLKVTDDAVITLTNIYSTWELHKTYLAAAGGSSLKTWMVSVLEEQMMNLLSAEKLRL